MCHSAANGGCQWPCPDAEIVKGCSCQQFVLWLQQEATMETLRGKGKTGRRGETGERQKKLTATSVTHWSKGSR